jgi:uncharacterized protein (DUF58 family)
VTDAPALLRARSEEEAARFPPLLARADQLAGTVLLGEHGRRRAGMGDDFWQYRPAQPGDRRRMIDWRRSAKSDGQFVREREWQIAQSVQLWLDQGASMRYASRPDLPQKIERARILTLAAAILMSRAGERVGLTGGSLPPRSGRAQLVRLAEFFTRDDGEDYAVLEDRLMLPHARAMFVSDFMGSPEVVEAGLTKAADRGVRGVLLQVLDPAEEAFPFRGRTIFESVGQSMAHDTLQARDLRDRYLARLAERKDRLQRLCRATGWHYHIHHTDQSPQVPLLWLFRALGGAAT